MGDAEEVSEGEITSDIDIDVLKVGHHGSSSSTSEAFLQRTTPVYAVISVGRDNSYGHPEDVVIERLISCGANIYRTDELGTVVVTSDGSSIDVDYFGVARRAQSLRETESISVSGDVSAATQAVMVWLSETGSRYHSKNDCGRMNPANARQVSLAQAKAQGFDPCGTCRPPS